jgi:hypothetical protein
VRQSRFVRLVQLTERRLFRDTKIRFLRIESRIFALKRARVDFVSDDQAFSDTARAETHWSAKTGAP